MDEAPGAESPPHHILDYTIRSRTRIWVSHLIPTALELFVFIAQIVADCALGAQHFRDHQPLFGWATLGLVFIPPVLTFVFVVTSRTQSRHPKYASRKHFLWHQLWHMLLFPFVAVYRLEVRLFWSAEALFHDDDDKERMRCLAKAQQCTTRELYRFIQAYGQAAPQIILQLYHMFTQDLFRDYETTNVQAICLVFAAIDLAAITTGYQRFESQHQVGRHYPWSVPQEVEAQRCLLAKNKELRSECERKKRDSQRTIASFPESDKIMANFKSRTSCEVTPAAMEVGTPKTYTVQVRGGVDEVDNEAVDTAVCTGQEVDTPPLDNQVDSPPPLKTAALIHREGTTQPAYNATDDDKLRTNPMLQRLRSIREEMRRADEIQILDSVPDSPPPLPPPLSPPPQLFRMPLLSQPSNETAHSEVPQKRSSTRISQLETFKDMLLVNAQLYIKEHVPHPPKIMTSRIDEIEKQQLVTKSTPPSTEPPSSARSQSPTNDDVVDFFLPRPTKVVNGIAQDDFAGKTIAFFGWIAYITMRMLALATFCIFYTRAFFILLGVHYVIMLVALIWESRPLPKARLNRSLFYMLLAYVYIFVLLEFRIRFRHIRLWLVGYFAITMAENITTTALWYSRGDFESWWFGFIVESIIYSGILQVATLIVYYVLLKPRNVALIVEDGDINKDSIVSGEAHTNIIT